jgi:hypothetical protein
MLSVKDSPELRAAVLAMKAANRSLRSDINKATRRVLSPIWKQAVESRATYARDARVIAKGAKVKAGNPAVAQAATSTKALSGGLVPSRNWAWVEFGSERTKVSEYTRKNRRNGGTHTVRRHTQRGLPPRYRTGRIAYPAFAEVAPRIISLWVQLIIRKYKDAAEGVVSSQ